MALNRVTGPKLLNEKNLFSIDLIFWFAIRSTNK